METGSELWDWAAERCSHKAEEREPKRTSKGAIILVGRNES